MEQAVSRSREKALAGDTQREATSTEVTDLRKENARLKEVVAETVLENRLLKKSVTGSGLPEDEACGWVPQRSSN
jgi:transposase